MNDETTTTRTGSLPSEANETTAPCGCNLTYCYCVCDDECRWRTVERDDVLERTLKALNTTDARRNYEFDDDGDYDYGFDYGRFLDDYNAL